MRLFYQLGYRYFRMPWDVGPRRELVQLVESGRLAPCRAIDLGCGTGANAIFLARRGFDVTGVDFASSAIAKAGRAADEAGVSVQWLVDDLTDLRHAGGAGGAAGTYDLLVDYGTFDDLGARGREAYVRSVLSLTRPGTRFLLWCFEWPLRWWERVLPFAAALEPGEVARRFGAWFEIETVARELDFRSGWPPGYAAYLLTRRSH